MYKTNNPHLHEVYEQTKSNPPESGNHRIGEAYLMGFNGIKPVWLEPGTEAYAAWAAGRDNAKYGGKQ